MLALYGIASQSVCDSRDAILGTYVYLSCNRVQFLTTSTRASSLQTYNVCTCVILTTHGTKVLPNENIGYSI